MDNPEKLATLGTQDEDKQNKNTICVGHHYAQANTNNVIGTDCIGSCKSNYLLITTMTAPEFYWGEIICYVSIVFIKIICWLTYLIPSNISLRTKILIFS